MVLSYGRGLAIFAVIGAAFAGWMTFVALWAYFMTPDHQGWTPGLVVLVAGGLWLLAGPLAIEVFRAWCRVTPTQITRHSPWRGTLSLRWEEVESVRYSAAADWYIIRSRRGTIRLDSYLDGIPEFLRIARLRIPAARWEAPRHA